MNWVAELDSASSYWRVQSSLWTLTDIIQVTSARVIFAVLAVEYSDPHHRWRNCLTRTVTSPSIFETPRRSREINHMEWRSEHIVWLFWKKANEASYHRTSYDKIEPYLIILIFPFWNTEENWISPFFSFTHRNLQSCLNDIRISLNPNI